MILKGKQNSTAPEARHVAIIMDGNGRWANKRGLPRTAGHKQGAETARQIVRDAAELGIEYITLFGFSSENWSRPDSEVKELMGLLRYYLRSETAELHKNNARLRVIGRRENLDADIVSLIEHAEDLTKDNDAITLVIALNYGGRMEIVEAAKRFATSYEEGQDAQDVFEQCLMTSDIPDPDILIRTSGEMRISNFLLWQCAYSEMIFTDTLWPDFSREDLEEALAEYASRDRRFGAIRQSHKAQR